MTVLVWSWVSPSSSSIPVLIVNAISHRCFQSSDLRACLPHQNLLLNVGDKAVLSSSQGSCRGAGIPGAEGSHTSTWSLRNYGEVIKVTIFLNPAKKKLWDWLKLPLFLLCPFFAHSGIPKAIWHCHPNRLPFWNFYSVSKWRSPSVELF